MFLDCQEASEVIVKDINILVHKKYLNMFNTLNCVIFDVYHK